MNPFARLSPSLRLLAKYILIQFKSQMQFRTSFLLLAFGQMLVPFTVFASLYFMFERFGSLRGWDFYEAALCYGVIHISVALAETFGRGFDTFSGLIVSGNFDRLLVRPRGTVLQVVGSRFEFARFGRLLQGITVLSLALSGVQVEWTIGKAALLLLMIASGVTLYIGIFMLTATFCFWTIEGLEVGNILTDGSREMAQYPLGIYDKAIRRFFTFVIPFGCVNYFPMLWLLGRADGAPLLYVAAPLAAMLFIVPCIAVWRFGVRHYLSTGS